jgi:hypothetical protein
MNRYLGPGGAAFEFWQIAYFSVHRARTHAIIWQFANE